MPGNAVIIGGGLGGLATAARLQAQGWSVTLLEKNERLGGRCNVLRQDGFTFDMGPSLLLMPDVLRSLFSSVGRDLDDYLELIRCDPNYRITFGDRTSVEISAHWDRMGQELDRMEPGASGALLRYLADAQYKYTVARERFVERNFRNWGEFATLGNLYYLLTTNTLRKLDRHASRYFRDPRLVLAFTFQTMYLGLPPRNAPSVYALLPYTEMMEGIWHPRGGMIRIADAIALLAGELGADLRVNAEVAAVETQGKRVTGVRMSDGTFVPADIVVANADLPYTYANLLPVRARGPFTDRRLRRLKNGSSAFLLYLGLDTQYPQLLHHNVFLSADPERNFDAIFQREELPDDPSLYVAVPGRSDPSMQPEGKDGVYVLVPVSSLTGRVCWERERGPFRDRVLDKLEALGLHDLRSHIIFERSFTPDDFVETYNTAGGNAFGISHNFWQVGYMRPANKARDMDNLYFVGASTVPGGGVPMVIIGSNLVAERIAEDFRNA